MGLKVFMIGGVHQEKCAEMMDAYKPASVIIAQIREVSAANKQQE